MGIFRITLGALRGAGAAVDRIAAEPAPPAARRPRPERRVETRAETRVERRESGLDAFFPSQSENAALLDAFVGHERTNV